MKFIIVNFADSVGISQHRSESELLAETSEEEEEDGGHCTFSDRYLRIDVIASRFLSTFRHSPVRSASQIFLSPEFITRSE